MSTVTEFLLARIADQIATAREVRATKAEDGPHPAGPDPASLWLAWQTIADCEAKLRIIARHTPVEFLDAPGEFGCAVSPTRGVWPCADLLDLAAVNADHADYREEWRR